MKYLFAILVLFIYTTTAAISETMWLGLNSHDHIRALVHIERGPRPAKWLKIKPGPAKVYYYEWVRSDGSTAIKMEDHEIAGIPNEAPLREAHPNLSILLPAAGFVGSGFQAATAFLVHN